LELILSGTGSFSLSYRVFLELFYSQPVLWTSMKGNISPHLWPQRMRERAGSSSHPINPCPHLPAEWLAVFQPPKLSVTQAKKRWDGDLI